MIIQRRLFLAVWLVLSPAILLAADFAKVGWSVTDDGQSRFGEIDQAWYDVSDRRSRILFIPTSGQTNLSQFKARCLSDTSKKRAISKRLITAWLPSPQDLKREWHTTIGDGFPPAGDYYKGHNSVRQYLWRFLGTLAPDLVIFIDDAHVGPVLSSLDAPKSSGDLQHALHSHIIAKVGSVPTAAISLHAESPIDDIFKVMGLADKAQFTTPLANNTIRNRKLADLKEVCQTLARVYGQSFPSMSYIPALSMRAKYRLGALMGDSDMQEDVVTILTQHAKTHANQKPKSGSAIGGHLIYSHLASEEPKTKAFWLAHAELGVDAARRYEGAATEFVMPFHSQMSDAVFMSGPLLAEVALLSDDSHLADLCRSHVQHMVKMNLRPDNIYRHSPLDQAAWGRGNGFPVLGLALVLDAGFAEDAYILNQFRKHITALLEHQDASGMWHQVIDYPGSYAEFTSTCMITYGLIRGLRNGWIQGEKYEKAVQLAIASIKGRISAEGELFDVCTGTGKQQGLTDYFHRTAILGRDARGGAMALTLLVEVLDWELSDRE